LFGLESNCWDDKNGKQEPIGKGEFFFLSNLGLGEICKVVVVEGECLIVPEIISTKENRKVLEVLASKAILQRSSSYSHQGVDVFKNQERLSP
jgi:hypothetical protein